jgi:hypothetical protein
MLTKTKKNPYQTLTKKSFDLFIKLLENFDSNYFHSSNRDTYLKGKQTSEKIKEITLNLNFKEVYLIWEQLDKMSDNKSDKYQILKNKLDLIKQFLN